MSENNIGTSTLARTVITRKLEFDAAHRVLRHGGKCRFLHGHRYVAEVSVTTERLDGLGMVMDFSFLKDNIGKWIDEHWDHNILLNSEDPLLRVYRTEVAIFDGRKPYIIEKNNPTVEVMAKILFRESCLLLPDNVSLVRVRLFETPNCWADYHPPTPI